MRKKKVTIDDAEFSISPLTLEQVDEFIAQLDKPLDPTADDVKKFKIELEQRARRVVAWGLDNALADDVSERWTPERVYRKLDLKCFAELQDEILSFSNLKGQKLTDAASGEDKPTPIM